MIRPTTKVFGFSRIESADLWSLWAIASALLEVRTTWSTSDWARTLLVILLLKEQQRRLPAF